MLRQEQVTMRLEGATLRDMQYTSRIAWRNELETVLCFFALPVV